MYYLRLLVLMCILGFSGVDFFNKDYTKNVLNNISDITTASQNYFNDIGYWPVSIRNLVDLNYLKNNIDGYSLSNQNNQLNILIDSNNKNDSILTRYFIKHKIDEKIKKILIAVNKNKQKESEYFFGVCSNLYCQSYKLL